tara:strand:+ start:2627 stop:3538 length:912 start_codon:yes stop_codon:yes gene_type:complete
MLKDMNMNIKKNINTQIIVGSFLFIMIIALGVFTIILGGSKVLKNQYNYEIIFNDIGGLQEGDSVFLRGKKIGYVKNTILNSNNVNVILSLDMPIVFYENYKIEVASASMLGGKILNINLGQLHLNQLSKTETLYGTDPIDIMADFHIAVHNLKNILDVILEEEGTLGKLIFDDGIYLALERLADGSGKILTKIDSGEGTIGKLLVNDSLYNDTEKLVDNFNKVTERVASGSGPLGQLLSEENKVIDDLQQAVNELNIALIKLNSTNSTIGKLLNDSELYDEGTKIIDDVRKSPLRFLIRNKD